MSAINDAELDEMRDDAVAELTATCTVSHTPTLVSDGAGGQTKSSPTTYGPYACRVEQSERQANNVPIVAGAVAPRRYLYIVLEPGALVAQGDIITVGSAKYTVIHVPDRTLKILLRVQCWESAS